jgi:cyclohexyl-isocyanide hydratase
MDELNRRAFGALSVGLAAGWAAGAAAASAEPELKIGVLLYPRLDQIDLTGPFEVLSRVPNASLRILGLDRGPVRDIKGLVLTPEATLAEAGPLDLLVVPGGPGQEALMEDERALGFIRAHVGEGRRLFSVCTGALLCGAAGVLKGRRATTHWSAVELLPWFGAVPVDQRVVVDGPVVTAAGVTAGIDGALQVAAMLRGEAAAQGIQLAIEYAPEPPFHAGTPKTAPAAVLAQAREETRALTQARLATAKRVAAKLGVTAG